jgi:hypothetical protein
MSPGSESIYSAPRTVDSLADCLYYHTMDLPGIGVVHGPWDLRPGISEYLGGVDFQGKRVLEVGTASGHLCFEMEARGAEVVSCDLGDGTADWDIVPFDGAVDREFAAVRSAGMSKINNSYWYAHAALGSSARVVYGSAYEVPAEIGPVDIALFGSVLLHLRDPFLALQQGLRLTTDTVIVTEVAGRSARLMARLPTRWQLPLLRSGRLPARMNLLPDPESGLPNETWWTLSPSVVSRMLGILGFSVEQLSFHTQLFEGRSCALYTMVARRPRGAGAPSFR